MVKFANFPFVKTREQFDFSFQPTLNKRKVEELFTLNFIDRRENVLFLGPPGVGKIHLAIVPWEWEPVTRTVGFTLPPS